MIFCIRVTRGIVSALSDTIGIGKWHSNRDSYCSRRFWRSVWSWKCKCHGVSGSCTTKTCWTTLPKFPRDRLRPEGQVQQSGARGGSPRLAPAPAHLPQGEESARFQKPLETDLVYIERSAQLLAKRMPKRAAWGRRGGCATGRRRTRTVVTSCAVGGATTHISTPSVAIATVNSSGAVSWNATPVARGRRCSPANWIAGSFLHSRMYICFNTELKY